MEQSKHIATLLPGDLIILIDGDNDGTHLTGQLVKLGLSVKVVRQWRQLQIDFVRSTGSYGAYVEGLPLQQASAIMYLSPPVRSQGQFDPADEGYLRTERERAIIALLLASSIRVVNRGWVARHDWNLRSPEHQLNILARIGWHTPDVTWSYDAASEKTGKLVSVELTKTAYITLNRHSWFVTPLGADSMKALPDERLLRVTMAHLERWDLDWISIPVVEHNEKIFAMGMSTLIPRELPSDDALDLISSSLFTR